MLKGMHNIFCFDEGELIAIEFCIEFIDISPFISSSGKTGGIYADCSASLFWAISFWLYTKSPLILFSFWNLFNIELIKFK